MSHSIFATIRKIRHLSHRAQSYDDARLKEESLGLKYRAMTGVHLANLVPHGFALVVEATRRQWGISHYNVQLECGIRLVSENIAEMKTGEGKTLTAALPTFLYALAGRGAHAVSYTHLTLPTICSV